MQLREHDRCFGHLHERKDSFHHACTTRRADDDHGTSRIDRALSETRDLFADDRAHTAADKREIHYSQADRNGFQIAFDGAGGVAGPSAPLRRFEPLDVWLQIDKLQWI